MGVFQWIHVGDKHIDSLKFLGENIPSFCFPFSLEQYISYHCGSSTTTSHKWFFCHSFPFYRNQFFFCRLAWYFLAKFPCFSVFFSRNKKIYCNRFCNEKYRFVISNVLLQFVTADHLYFLLWVVASVEVTYFRLLFLLEMLPRILLILTLAPWCKRLLLLHNFIQQSLTSGSAQVTILLAACQRFAMARISDTCPGWK